MSWNGGRGGMGVGDAGMCAGVGGNLDGKVWGRGEWAKGR